MTFHPGEGRLLRFQDGTVGERARRRIASHLATCQPCRNLVQGHRGVRVALLLEAPAAPAGVLERALATRASGTILMLPVADPDSPALRRPDGEQWRSWRRPRFRAPRGLGASLLRVGALAGTAAAMGAIVINLVSTTPVFSLGISDQGWARLRQGVIDFDPLGFGTAGSRGLAWEFERPLAEPAVLHPERLRPFTAMYMSHDIRQEDPAALPLEVGSALSVHQLEFTPDRAVLRIHDNSATVTLSRIELDRATMVPRAWTATSRIGGTPPNEWAATREYHTRLEGGELVSGMRFENIRGELPGALGNPSPEIREPLVRPPEPVTTLGFAHLTLQLQAADLSAHWRGSFRDDAALTNPEAHYWWTTSLEVDGSETITIPAGTFDAWVVKAYDLFQQRGVYHVAKSNGVVLRWSSEPGRPIGGLVYYPNIRTVTELQSISYP